MLWIKLITRLTLASGVSVVQRIFIGKEQKMSQRNSLDLLSRKEGMCLLEQSMGFVWQAALRAVAVLGVADHLVEGKNPSRNWRRS